MTSIPPQEGTRRQLLQAVAWNTLFAPIRFVVEVAANLLKVNLLTRAEIGAISLVSSAANSAGLWLDLGIEQTLPRFIPEAEAHSKGVARRFLERVVVIKLALIGVALALTPWWGSFLVARLRAGAAALAAEYGDSAVGPLIAQLGKYAWVFVAAVAILVVAGALYDTLMAYLISFFRRKAWNVLQITAALMLPILSVLAVVLGAGVVGVLGAMTLTAVLSVGMTAWHVGRVSGGRAVLRDDPQPVPGALWRRFVPYTALAFVMSVSEYFSSQYFAVLLLGGNLGNVAVFWIAYNFVKQVQAYAYTPLVGLQVPLFTRIRVAGDAQLVRVHASLSRLLLVLCLPSAVGLALLLPNLIMVQFPRYAEAISPGLLLIPFLFLEPFWGLGHNILMVHERYRIVLLSRLVALASLPLMLVLIPRIGLHGAALALGLGKTGAGLVVSIAAARRYELRFPWRFAAKIALAAGAMAAVLAGPLAWLGRVPADASIALRLAFFAACVGLALLGGACWLLVARRLHLLSDDDRVVLGDLRHPLARRVVKLLG